MTLLAIASMANDHSICALGERREAADNANIRSWRLPSVVVRDLEKCLRHIVGLAAIRQAEEFALPCGSETMPKHICERSDAEQV